MQTVPLHAAFFLPLWLSVPKRIKIKNTRQRARKLKNGPWGLILRDLRPLPLHERNGLFYVRAWNFCRNMFCKLQKKNNSSFYIYSITLKPHEENAYGGTTSPRGKEGKVWGNGPILWTISSTVFYKYDTRPVLTWKRKAPATWPSLFSLVCS